MSLDTALSYFGLLAFRIVSVGFLGHSLLFGAGLCLPWVRVGVSRAICRSCVFVVRWLWGVLLTESESAWCATVDKAFALRHRFC